MRKLNAQEIKEGAKAFAEGQAKRYEQGPPVGPGHVFYKLSLGPPRVVTAKIKDDAGKEWKTAGECMRDAYNALICELENAGGPATRRRDGSSG